MNRLGSPGERKRIALGLTRDIRLSSFLAKRATRWRDRNCLYSNKHRKISLGLTRFPEFFRLVSVENRSGAILLLVRLADGATGSHIPWNGLTDTAKVQMQATVSSWLEQQAEEFLSAA